MRRSDINKGENLRNQIRGLLSGIICLVIFFAAMIISILILEYVDDYHLKAVLLIINTAVEVILMIFDVIFIFVDQHRLLKKGKCPYKFAFDELIMAIVLEAIFLFIHIHAIFDFLGRI